MGDVENARTSLQDAVTFNLLFMPAADALQQVGCIIYHGNETKRNILIATVLLLVAVTISAAADSGGSFASRRALPPA